MVTGVRIARRLVDVRVTGLAAEMTFYALLSLWPLLVALGSSLGFLERFIGTAEVQRLEGALVGALDAVFSTEITEDVLSPLVQGLLQQERAGVALGGFLLALTLAGRVFRGVIRALDAAYRVEDRRGIVALWLLSVLFSLGAIATFTSILSLVVVGPLLGGGRQIAGWLGLGPLFEFAWRLVRWPAVFIVATLFLTLLYHAGPNVESRWKHSFPGAVVGVVGIALVAVGLRFYLETVGAQGPQIEGADEAVALAAQVIGAVLATLLWFWLSSIALLVGGAVNAELSRPYQAHDSGRGTPVPD